MADWIPELMRLNSKREKGLITDKQFKIAEKALVPPALIGVPFLETITYEIDNATTGFLNLRSKVGSYLHGNAEPGLEIYKGIQQSNTDKDFVVLDQFEPELVLSRSAVQGAVDALRSGKVDRYKSDDVISGWTDLRGIDYVVQRSSEWDEKLGEPTGLVSLNTMGNYWGCHTPVPLSALTKAAEILQLFPNP